MRPAEPGPSGAPGLELTPVPPRPPNPGRCSRWQPRRLSRRRPGKAAPGRGLGPAPGAPWLRNCCFSSAYSRACTLGKWLPGVPRGWPGREGYGGRCLPAASPWCAPSTGLQERTGSSTSPVGLLQDPLTGRHSPLQPGMCGDCPSGFRMWWFQGNLEIKMTSQWPYLSPHLFLLPVIQGLSDIHVLTLYIHSITEKKPPNLGVLFTQPPCIGGGRGRWLGRALYLPQLLYHL